MARLFLLWFDFRIMKVKTLVLLMDSFKGSCLVFLKLYKDVDRTFLHVSSLKRIGEEIDFNHVYNWPGWLNKKLDTMSWLWSPPESFPQAWSLIVPNMTFLLQNVSFREMEKNLCGDRHGGNRLKTYSANCSAHWRNLLNTVAWT